MSPFLYYAALAIYSVASLTHGSVPQVESKMNVITVLYVGGVRGGAWSLQF